MHPLRYYLTSTVALASLALASLLLIFPTSAFEAAIRGVEIWWDVLFPALFPFFVISEMLLGFGIVHFFGTLLDPLMRPLFRVPGIGGFVMAMGFASGYPVGARLTSQLWEQRLVNREEGERLVAFTSTSDPIFLIGAVSVGFFHDVGLAGILAISHYGAAFLIGLIMRFHGPPTKDSPVGKEGGNLWLRAFNAMHYARIQDGRPFGKLLQQAVESALKLIMVVGGLVVVFSVVLEMLTKAHAMNFSYAAIDWSLHVFAIPAELSQAIVNGFFEVTLGAKSSGAAGDHIALVSKVAIAAFILSWGGLSVHAQIASLLTRTNLRYRPFVIARFMHAFLSALMVVVLWGPLQSSRENIGALLPVLAPIAHPFPFSSSLVSLPGLVFIFTCTVLISLSFIFYFVQRIWLYRNNH